MKSVLHLNYYFTLVPILVKAQRRLGWKAESASFTKSLYGFHDDYYIGSPKWLVALKLLWKFLIAVPAEMNKYFLFALIAIVRKSGYLVESPPCVPHSEVERGHDWKWKLARAQMGIIEFMDFALQFAWRYDVLHFHYHSALPCNLGYIDLPLWRLLGRKVIMQYEGSEVRGHPHILPKIFANAILVTTPDLLQWEPKATYAPALIDLNDIPYVGVAPHPGPLVILHAPTNRPLKGTGYIIEAVKTLQNEGYAVELDIVEKVAYVDALERYKKADIVIDQVLVGWYGYVAIEAMALGKPVMVYIKNNMKRYMADAPLCLTSASTLVDDLRNLVEDVGRREKLGRDGRVYVLKNHDADTIARRITDLYA